MQAWRRRIPKRCLGALRAAGETQLTALAIADALMAAKKLPGDDAALRRHVGDGVLAALRQFEKRGVVRRVGTTNGTHWMLASDRADA